MARGAGNATDSNTPFRTISTRERYACERIMQNECVREGREGSIPHLDGGQFFSESFHDSAWGQRPQHFIIPKHEVVDDFSERCGAGGEAIAGRFQRSGF